MACHGRTYHGLLYLPHPWALFAMAQSVFVGTFPPSEVSLQEGSLEVIVGLKYASRRPIEAKSMYP